MTGGQQMMLGGGGGVRNAGVFTLREIRTLALASASISLNPSGAVTLTGTGSSGPASWFTPVVGTPGNGYWVKFALSSGLAWDAGLVAGTLYALSVTRSVVWSMTSGAGVKTAVATASIYADAAGTQLRGVETLNVDVESLP